MTPQRGIAHYDVTSKIGEGGMGAVYRATDTKLNREVAIKVLPDAFAADPDRLARFTREAQVLASLNHPNIAAIYGVEDRALVLELVEGAELKGPLSESEALPVIHQLIDALEYAHDKGIVHRDLKPANLKLTPENRLKVLDFGLAKALASDPVESSPANSPTLTMRATMAGVIMGTAAYMAPEQARGNNVDRRADIWAFGAVVYEMLTGRVLFEGPTVSDTLAAVLTRIPDFEDVPPRFRRLLRLCLERDVRQRLSHISGARILLEPEQASEIRARRGPWIAVTAALGAIALAALAFAWRASQRDPSPLIRLDVDLGPESAAGTRSSVSLTPDGARVLFPALNAAGREVLGVRKLTDAKATILPETEGLLAAEPSPDGQWVAYVADTRLRKAPLNGGASALLAENIVNPRGMTWAQDGSIIISTSPTSGLFRVPPNGGKLEAITNPLARKQMTHRWPQFIPGRQAILYTAHTSTTGLNSADIEVLDLKNGQSKTVVKGGFFGRYLDSGHVLFVHDANLLAVRFDRDKLEAIGTPVPILDDVAANLTTANGRFTFAPARGLFAYVAGALGKIDDDPLVWAGIDGKTSPLFPGYAFGPALSPDGRRVVLSTGSVGQSDIQIWDITREVLAPITFNHNENRNPLWAPDGKHLVYTSFLNGTHTIWWARADGGSEPRKLLERPVMMVPASFSADGRRLAFHAYENETRCDLWTLPLDLGDPDKPSAGTPESFLRTPANEYSPQFSPDGRWIAYTSDESGHAEVYVRPFPGPGGKWQISGGDGVYAKWSRDLRRIWFAQASGQMMTVDCEIRGSAFEPGKPRPWGAVHVQLPLAPETANRSFEFSADGTRLLGHVRSVNSRDNRTGGKAVFLLNFADELRRRVP